MNRHLRNRLQYHRHLGNTMSALSVAAVMLVATMMVAAPAQPAATRFVAQTATETLATSAEQRQVASLMQAHEIEARAQQLATEIETTRNTGEAIAYVAAFTAEVATVAALTAALDELPKSAETADIAAPAPDHSTRKHKRNRQSLAMPYFSFASRS